MRGLSALLEEKQASLLNAIEECRQERVSNLRAQLHEHRAMMENSGMVGYTQEVLKETDQPCFVQAAKQIHNRYLDISSVHWCISSLWLLEAFANC